MAKEFERHIEVTFYQNRQGAIHANADVYYFSNGKFHSQERKLMFHLQSYYLTPELLYYEIKNGFPSFPDFDPKKYDEQSYDQVWEERIPEYDFWEIASFETDRYACYPGMMSEYARTLFEGFGTLLVERNEDFTDCSGIELGCI